MKSGEASRLEAWGRAWVGLALALALHVLDEALTGFLPRYNAVVADLHEAVPWLPLPTFTFGVWLAGLIAAVCALLAASPLVFRGRAWMRPAAYAFAFVMILNALGHAGASVYWGEWAPGVYSSPVLLGAAVWLLVTTPRTKAQRQPTGRPT